MTTEALDRKIVAPHTLAARLRAARASGKTVVQCHGCFDVVHPGHIRYLRFARQLGDILVVSLTSDAAIAKGCGRPYIPQELRAENLAALAFVDWVVIDPHPTAAELLELARPDVYVKGREYAQSSDPRFMKEREIVESYGGRVVFHSGDIVFSSTQLVNGLERDEALDEVRLQALCERRGIDLAGIQRLLDRLPELRVLVVGDAFRETYVACDGTATVPDAPVLDLQELAVTSYAGGAAALALHLAALGAQTTLITAGGEDEATARLVAELAERHVRVEGPSRPRQRLVERRTFLSDDTKLLSVTSGGIEPLDSRMERALGDSVSKCLPAADLLIYSEHGLGVVSPGLVQRLCGAARKAGVLIAGQAPGPRGNLELLTDLDLLCVTERRARETMHDMASGLPAMMWRLLHQARSRRALVTLHKRGFIGFDGRPEQPDDLRPRQSASPDRLLGEYVPNLARHYIDLLGVPEAVAGIASLVLAAGGSLGCATYLAAGAEALAASRPGHAAVTLSALHAWIQTRPELRPQRGFLPDNATCSDIAHLALPLAEVAGGVAMGDPP